MCAKFYFRLKLKNPFTRIKAFLDERIKRAVNRELSNIFRKQGSIAVDHHIMEDSWAVIKVDVEDCCYLKFLKLDMKDLRELQNFLRHFERARVDSTPSNMRLFNGRINDLFY